MIDEEKLIEYANNHTDGKIDANDIARFPKEDAQLLVHAHWVHDSELYYGMHNSYHCSKCGRIIRIVVPETHNSYHCSKRGRITRIVVPETLEDYPYCHCGAKMDEK